MCIYGPYPVLDGKDTEFYRHTITPILDFTAHGGKDKWASYTFIKNVYEIWMPAHLPLGDDFIRPLISWPTLVYSDFMDPDS